MKRRIALWLCVSLMASLFTGCNQREEVAEEPADVVTVISVSASDL